jgi:hypothetical protein
MYRIPCSQSFGPLSRASYISLPLDNNESATRAGPCEISEVQTISPGKRRNRKSEVPVPVPKTPFPPVLQVLENQSAQGGLFGFRKQLFFDGLFTYHAGCISISPTSAISWMDCEPQFGFTAGGRSYAARRFECRMIPCADCGGRSKGVTLARRLEEVEHGSGKRGSGEQCVKPCTWLTTLIDRS